MFASATKAIWRVCFFSRSGKSFFKKPERGMFSLKLVAASTEDKINAVAPLSNSLSLRIESADILAKIPTTPPVTLSDWVFASYKSLRRR